MIDSHCHLDFDAFDGIREDVIEEARTAGIHTIINVGADLASSERSVKLAQTHDAIRATVGIHPHDAKTLTDGTFAQLKKLAATDRVVAIGEIGLDYYRDLSPRPVQRKTFNRQLQLAVEMKMPVVIHTREAFEETIEIVEKYAHNLPGGVFHCFSGDAGDASRVFDLGFIISVGGVITYKNSGMARMAAEVPLDKIMLETDAPYLTPVPHRGKTNRPAYVSLVCDKLAELRGVPAGEIEKVTDRTCRKLFRLVETFGG
ncbi:MAG: hydrolase TatD [Candidatus Zixiibacteriota bacterium]|nr:MAG: hydrolase TatD [candidate division Zixibacteria bacterium]